MSVVVDVREQKIDDWKAYLGQHWASGCACITHEPDVAERSPFRALLMTVEQKEQLHAALVENAA